MKHLKAAILVNFILLVYSCGAVKDGFTNQKKNSSDEFLVEKKAPLVMPPNYDELPMPEAGKTVLENENNSIKDLVTNNENENLKSEKISKINKNLEESLLEKIKEN
tara:strand:- start:47 stop:367 length:321 start_codon:yes stop_codon:yes gene_type:complete